MYMKKTIALIISGAALTMACSVETEPEANVEQGEEAYSCTAPDAKKYEFEATLAVAAAKELRRWEPDVDFYIHQGRQWDWSTYSVQLTQAGLNQCAANGKTGCPIVSDLLALQWNGEPEIAGHKESWFRQTLVAHLDRYIAFKRNNMIPQVDNVTLDPSHVTQWSCGPMNWFISSDPDASKLWAKMIAYGGATKLGEYPENPFLNFSWNGREVGVDPNNDMTGDGSTTASGSCSTAPSKIDYTHACAGTCCFVNSKYGTYQKVYGTRATYSCKTP